MKRFFYFSFFILLITAINYSQVNSPWKWAHPTPQGNTLRYVKVFSSTTWYALGYAGTFLKTTNGGANWFINHEVFGEMENSQYFAYSGWFTDLNTGFACGSSGKLSRTTNGGVNWDTISTPSTATLYGIHFINASTGFISTSTSGDILKTTNAGANWTNESTGTSLTMYNIFALDANHIYLPSSSGNLRYTTNGGTNWTTVATGASTLYDACFKDANTGWVCGSSTNIRVTTNGGANWTSTSTGLPSSTFYEITYASNTVYVSGNSYYAFRSTDFGMTWDSIEVNSTNYYTSTYYTLDRNGTTMATAGAFGLIHTSTNTGANWVAHNYLGYAGTVNDIWCNTMTGLVIAVGSSSAYPILRSTNGGTNWEFEVANNVGTYTAYGINMINSNTGFVTASSSKLFKTTNGGANWDSSTVYSTSTTLYCPDFINANTGWISGSSGRVFMTTDGGANWTLQTTGTTSTLYRIDMIDANTGYFVGSSGTVRKTTDGGANWTSQTPNYTSTLYWIKMFNANSGYLCGISGTVRKTTNGGTNWDTVATPFTQSQYGLSFINMNTGFVCGSSGYTIRTSNGGSNWQILNTSGSTMNSVFAKGYDSAWVGGSSGMIFRLYDAILGGVFWNNEIPERFTLSQNYPNPFNPITTIKFGLPKAGKVSFKIYDITGREVESVFDNVELNAGTVTYKFDGTNYATGVYFYTLYVNDERIDTKKMILIK